jgi:hypothetical protein
MRCKLIHEISLEEYNVLAIIKYNLLGGKLLSWMHTDVIQGACVSGYYTVLTN